ncbi:MAG: ATP-binding protein [Smithella sp.]
MSWRVLNLHDGNSVIVCLKILKYLNEKLSKIFEPFFTTKPANEGTGLGLSIAHMIMERLNGTIDVESKENQGTAFFINLQPKNNVFDTKEE